MSNPQLKAMFAELARGKDAQQPARPQPVKISMAEFAQKVEEIESMEDFAGRQHARNTLADAIRQGMVILERRHHYSGSRVAFERLN